MPAEREGWEQPGQKQVPAMEALRTVLSRLRAGDRPTGVLSGQELPLGLKEPPQARLSSASVPAILPWHNSISSPEGTLLPA